MSVQAFTAPAAECTDRGGHYPHTVTVERDGERLVAQCEGSAPITRETVEGWVQQYVAALDAAWQRKCDEAGYHDILRQQHYGYTMGQKYARVVVKRYRDSAAAGDAVEAFVDLATGDVLKADGFKRPAKGVRYRMASAEGRAALFAACGQPMYLYR